MDTAKVNILTQLIHRKGSGRISASLLIHYEASPAEVEARLNVLSEFLLQMDIRHQHAGREMIDVRKEISQLHDYLNMLLLLVEVRKIIGRTC